MPDGVLGRHFDPIKWLFFRVPGYDGIIEYLWSILKKLEKRGVILLILAPFEIFVKDLYISLKKKNIGFLVLAALQ